MSAINHFTQAARLLALASLAACYGMGSAQAQGTAAVTEADIARVQRNQPVITDQDMARAAKAHRLPMDAALERLPKSSPNIDALPQPAASSPLDLEALARGYQAGTEGMAMTQGLSARPALMIFISFSMPQPTLQRLVDQAARAQATLLIRGFVDGSLRETVTRMQALIGQRQVAVQIDPQAFDRFAVTRTPTFVLVRAGAKGEPCGAGQCLPAEAFMATSGDVSLDYALAFIERQAPRFARDARMYVKKLKG
ncbi:type-F conjugative transfer system pilin assembly protein TrbC [Noviherbaspirillum sedimenti]|uniref:Type-F conjugative transfer system pilin assembly protein TrbC n=1 Tax=Noviherbaspirillum sedimenti TaxID=2320865 RepID=A0A3A3G0X8_9BURK|nr:type-F conjugative transfer system pilin assembly protein TrbC [Noviherbaspirillum sedimenti]RJG00559.1 type-F conjugative transfer system pilin assembly protein TrbC [Noviherbaspirillum sedimenti]